MILLLLTAGPAHAIHVHALYTASCQREIGIVLDVGPRRVQLLNLDGRIVEVERFEVIYYATFSLDVVPMRRVDNPEKVPLVEVRTFQNGDLERLVLGWPVDFNKDKISFLNLKGSEVVIDRTSIWRIEFNNQSQALAFESRALPATEFVHPYAFAGCAATKTAGANTKATRAYPQTLLSDPVAIKREFDRLAKGHEEIRNYVSAQQFYAVPEVYHNSTSLGLWMSGGSRYGASKTRSNNFTPYLVDEFSGGPFGFQSFFASGSGPMLQTIHEEPQTQVLYRMKADYFHFSGMADPGLLLVGAKYQWAENDLARVDARGVESSFVEFGFDYGKIALEMYLGGTIETAARFGNYFARNVNPLPRIGLRYQSYTWWANVMAGSGGNNGYNIGFFRANAEWERSKSNRFQVSFIRRTIGYDGEDPDNGIAFTANSESSTGALYGYWRVKTRYWFGVMAAVEQLSLSGTQGTDNESKTETQIKGGALVSLSF